MDRADFSRMLKELLDLQEPPAGARKLEDIEEWDSFAVISFIAMIDENYGVRLAPKAIAACETVDDLAKLVEQSPANGKR